LHLLAALVLLVRPVLMDGYGDLGCGCQDHQYPDRCIDAHRDFLLPREGLLYLRFQFLVYLFHVAHNLDSRTMRAYMSSIFLQCSLHVCIIDGMSLIEARERYRRAVADAKEKYAKSDARARALLDRAVALARADLERTESMGRSQIASLGGKARAESLSSDRRQEIARNAAAALNHGLTEEQRRAAAQRAARARWARREDPVREYLAAIGRRGGQAQVPKGTAALSQSERQERGRQGAAVRWGKPKKKRGARSAFVRKDAA
jgi:hypothetical protein